MSLKQVFVEAFDIPDAWYQCLQKTIEFGRDYKVEKGSYEGQYRKELDYITIHIKKPGFRPLIPIIPPDLGIEPPTDMNYVNKYFEEYLLSPLKEENEEYTYGERINISLFKVIDMLKNSPKTNQAILQIGRPEDIDSNDPPCVLPETLILTINGYKRADEIQENDVVFTHNGNWKKVTKIYKRKYTGNINKIKIKGFGYELNLTPEHPVYNIKIDKCPYDSRLNCRPNCKKQFSVYSKYQNGCPALYKNYNNNWTNAEELNSLNYIAIPKIKTELISNITNEEMYIFGLWLADGDLNGGDGLRFSLGSHQYEIIYKLTKYMRKTYNLEPHFDTHKKDVVRVIYYSRDLYNKYLKLFGNIQRERKIPFDFILYNKEKLKNLIDGYIDGDGYRRKNMNNTEFYTSSLYLKESFLLILNRLGIIPSVSTSKPKDTIIENRIIKSKGEGYNISFTNGEKQKNEYWEDEKYFYLPIRNNEIIPYDGYVYNYEVEDDNSYIANGIPVHNCLRHIDCRILDGKLHFIIYFRSWDLWGGLPSNLAGLQLLKEFMCEQIGCEDGEMICSSKGLHLYDFAWEFARTRVYK